MPTSLRYGSAALDCTQQNLILACLSARITHFTPALQSRDQFRHRRQPHTRNKRIPTEGGSFAPLAANEMILLALALTAVAEVADAVVDEDTRLQDGRHGGRHGAGAGGGGRRGSARRVLVDDEVIGGRRGGGGGGHVAAAEEAREGRRKAGADAASEGSREHFSPPLLPLSWPRPAVGFFFSPSPGETARVSLFIFYQPPAICPGYFSMNKSVPTTSYGYFSINESL